MQSSTRRTFFSRLTALTALATSAPRLFAQQAAPTPAATPHHHIQNGVYYFSGTGSNDGYPKEDHVLVTDPFEKHVTRTMDALKKSLEKAGCTMDSMIQAQVFLCLPLADGLPMPAGKARFDAHKAQYEALNKIYKTYFSPGSTPARSCMALEWIPGDSLIEISGCALVVQTPTATTAGE